MVFGAEELSRASEITADLLDEIGLRNYLFELEPREDCWQVRLEYPTDDGWQMFRLPVHKEQLLSSRTNADTHQAILDQWQQMLPPHQPT